MASFAILNFPHFTEPTLPNNMHDDILLLAWLLPARGWVQLRLYPVVEV
jgi:hypothetical protein